MPSTLNSATTTSVLVKLLLQRNMHVKNWPTDKSDNCIIMNFEHSILCSLLNPLMKNQMSCLHYSSIGWMMHSSRDLDAGILNVDWKISGYTLHYTNTYMLHVLKEYAEPDGSENWKILEFRGAKQHIFTQGPNSLIHAWLTIAH